MADLTDSAEETNPVGLVDELAERCRKYMAPYSEIWREGHESYYSRGFVDDPDSVEVKINKVLDAVEHNVPRDATALHPGRPYLPFRAKNDALYGAQARAKVRAIDSQMDKAAYFDHFVDCLKFAELYGNGYLEVFWDIWTERANPKKPNFDQFTGQFLGFSEAPTEVQKDGLKFRAHAPWAVLTPPGGRTLTDKSYTIFLEAVPRYEITRLIDEKVIDLTENVTSADLKAGPTGDFRGKYLSSWMSDMSAFGQYGNDDIGILMRLYSENRWIGIWNYSILLWDSENRTTNMDKRVKPAACLRFNPRIGGDRFYGQGIAERIRANVLLLNAIYTLELDAQFKNNARWVLFNRRFVDGEDLRDTENGGLIELRNADELDSLDNALRIIDGPAVNDGIMRMGDILNTQMDGALKQYDIARGVAPTPKQTLGGMQMLSEAAGVPLGFQGKYAEATFLPELLYLVSKTASENMTLVQLMDDAQLSMPEAIEVMNTDPEGIPGGFESEFDGSERVAERERKYQKVVEVGNMTMQHPMIQNGPGAGILLKKMYELTDAFENDELEQIFMQEPAPAEMAPPPGMEGAAPQAAAPKVVNPSEIGVGPEPVQPQGVAA